jgi:TPP-dependent pyruvate/acetoin dehydrogenase alpha subunit
MKGEDSVVLCFFGDGAANEGAFHESLNMAGRWKLPVIFICENNLYGMSVSVKVACAVEDIGGRARGYSMPGIIVDGQNVLEVRAAVKEAIERARKGEGPTLIEAKTYRYRGHSRSDARKYRTKEEEEYWHGRDPIDLFSKHLTDEGTMSEDEVESLRDEVEQSLEEAEQFAVEESPYPEASELYNDVYAGWIEGERGLVRL